LVLLWPAIWLMDDVFDTLIPVDWREQIEENGSIEIGKKRVGKDFIEGLFAHSDREAELRQVHVPTLLIHGEADTEVPVLQSRRAFDILSEPKRLVTVPGAKHCLREPMEQDLVIKEATTWLNAYLT
jgi:pimeloyl-ACP methyl ester carboxylesterase